ncbi:MAG: TetR/AcrR family transcriptional regulator [bacterium]|nr:TetR/AcrR family transcriptional regulator [bacterium]
MNQKDTILLTAFKMFAENGYDGVSLNSIIKETGLTKGGVYYHFSSKEELFKEVVEIFILNYFTEKVRDIVNNSRKSIKKRLKDLYYIPVVLQKEVETLFSTDSNAFAFHLMFDAARKIENMKKKFAHCYLEITDLISALFKEGIDTNKIKDNIHIESLSIELVSLLDGVQIYTAMVSDVKIESLLNNIFTRTWDSIKK